MKRRAWVTAMVAVGMGLLIAGEVVMAQRGGGVETVPPSVGVSPSNLPSAGFGGRGGGFGGGRGGGGRRGGGGGFGGGSRAAPGDYSDRHGVTVWETEERFKKELFTFARVEYTSYGAYPNAWWTDAPDSDLNFSYRLQELTSIKTNPHPAVVKLTDKNLGDYPFLYMLEVARLQFSDEEVVALREYLKKGGFLMVDDFWGEAAWYNFHEQMSRVFPDREPEDLDISHPIFHCVFDLKEKPQVPGIDFAMRHQTDGVTWEQQDAKEAHYRAYKDDKGRIMAIICQNTDLGDGWEREGESEWYFHEFSEKKGYPMGVNIVFYAMTH